MNYRKEINDLCKEINDLLDKQDNKGMEKYGMALEQNPAGILERLQHSVEEKIDDLRYTFWAMDRLKSMWVRFPRIKFVDVNSLAEQLDHVRSEHKEVWLAFEDDKIGDLAMELFDLIHSCETALRILQESFGIDLRETLLAVIDKNKKRGYYENAGKTD
ncbi:hypothetical protein Dred_1199 [Desulforamulus reducens MI-1]|uniref:Uncharacterized protein n=1 Tax=Desulforamulus reducens (strain ATCC BAA-1160 / DSM 100696 / MI-1) TaxID=349161 RepID=A4J3T0_DESRM|nr:hypothetical protein [Desulforamulus reducens]ABO49733.1 hypothetical protein Dred_1199 [Desulforamulus reducens MI-1]